MDVGEIPPEVARFIAAKIDSVPHLEALLLLWQSSPQGWSAEEIAVRVYLPPERALEVLHDLGRQHLVKLAAGATAVFQYDAAWDETGATMQHVAATYGRHLVRVANLIHSKASPAVRDFARAFQFKKER
jgi:predicted ArsR family transcriptional regulator